MNDMTVALAEFYSAEIRLANTYNGLLIIGYLENGLTMTSSSMTNSSIRIKTNCTHILTKLYEW